jgi:hypothetical protein
MQESIWNNVIPTWVEAIGTFGAVVVALFARPIRDFFNRPKLEFHVRKMTNVKK